MNSAPQAYLAKRAKPGGRKYESAEINCVINRTLIVDDTNLKISKRCPSDYVQNLIPANHHKPILKSHFIEEAAEHAMLHDNYEDFLQARNSVLTTEIIKRISM